MAASQKALPTSPPRLISAHARSFPKMQTLTWLAAAMLALVTVALATPPAGAQPSCRDVDFQDPCVVICPATDLQAAANSDGSITVHADVNDTADLYRQAGGKAPQLVAGLSPSQTTFHDTNTTVGVTYTYALVFGPALCAQATVTAIPVLPNAAAGAAAAALGVAAYAALRRR